MRIRTDEQAKAVIALVNDQIMSVYVKLDMAGEGIDADKWNKVLIMSLESTIKVIEKELEESE